MQLKTTRENMKDTNIMEEHKVDKKNLEEDLGEETGYVSGSSLNSRKAVPENDDQPDDRLYVNRRKTKSERDKRRSSRVSLLEANNDSESENSNSSLEQAQPRYRKRANSKRHENENKENAGYRRRAGSKNSPQLDRIDSAREPQFERIDSAQELEPQHIDSARNEQSDNTNNDIKTNKIVAGKTIEISPSQMNKKDIYFGTWNPKERAVLDQVLHNIDLKPEHRKSFRDKLKRGSTKKKAINENVPAIIPNHEKYPMNQYSPKLSNNRKSRLGIFSGLKKIKDNVLKRHDRIDENEIPTYFHDDPLHHYAVSKKKKGIFKRFGKKKEDEMLSRRRAQSTNDYVRSVALVMDQKNTTNLTKQKSGSTHSLKALFTRAKSVDNLNGAFEYFANQNQVFKRTPSVVKLDKYASNERLENTKRSGSQKSLCHGFEAVQPSAKELCYDDNMVYAQAKMIQPSTASQRSLNCPPPMHHGYYDSAFEDDLYRGYQSDRSPSIASAYPAYHHHQSFSDAEYSSLRAHSSMSAYPSYFPSQRQLGHAPPPFPGNYHQHTPRSGYNTPGYATPGYATPGCATPTFGTLEYSTPGCTTPCPNTPGLNSGYTSENDYGQIPHAQISMVPYYARRAIQRSLSKNSAASNSSNYGYQSESSFCDDEDVYGMVHPNKSRGKVNLKRNVSKVSQISTDL